MILVAHQVVATQTEAGIIICADTMKKARPQALERIGDVGKPEAIEHYGAQTDYAKTGN